MEQQVVFVLQSEVGSEKIKKICTLFNESNLFEINYQLFDESHMIRINVNHLGESSHITTVASEFYRFIENHFNFGIESIDFTYFVPNGSLSEAFDEKIIQIACKHSCYISFDVVNVS